LFFQSQIKIPRKFLFLISQHHQTCANADGQRAELGDVCGDVSDVSLLFWGYFNGF